MNQGIFEMGLSVETTSVYLLCCGLSDSDTIISTKNLLKIWNSTEDALSEGLRQLGQRNILVKILSEMDGNDIYKLTDISRWK